MVLYHLNTPNFSYGFLSVDTFFVISGFLMALLYNQCQVRDFYRRRALRLLPAYFATVCFRLCHDAVDQYASYMLLSGQYVHFNGTRNLDRDIIR